MIVKQRKKNQPGFYMTCPICDKVFFTHPSRKSKFCSRACFKKSDRVGITKPWKNKILSKQHKENISKGLRNAVNKPGAKKGNRAWNKGIPNPNMKGAKNYNWKKGTILTRGYIYKLRPDHPFCTKSGYVHESRLVIEEHIKKFLPSQTVVHHINKVITDNRLENLMAFVNNGKHRSFHYHPERVPIESILFDGRVHNN